MTSTIRVIRIHRTGGPDVLQVEQVAQPVAGPNEVVVRHSAVGVNFIDVYHRSGLYPLPNLPSGIGSEAAGIVEALGPGVENVKLGDRVAYATGGLGAYSDARVVAAERLVPLPDEISDEVAAAALLKGMTAEYLIRRTYDVKPGQTVLFHAAAGGVGLIACQWLKSIGARVIGTVGTEAKARLARENGCDEVIIYTREDFAARVRELTDGQGVPVVYDSVGKATFMKSLDCLQSRGLFVGFGNASGKPDPFDMQTLSLKGSLYLTRPTLASYTAKREELVASASAVWDAIRSKAVNIQIGQRFPLADARRAHEALESRNTTGSTLLLV